ncbi:MAG: dihydropyrimidine dehydrogenase [Bacteriovoracaceae bacterium]|nr:dihydropyrimidine dehydrogenase [Bacteriovoracaceae bacterium]
MGEPGALSPKQLEENFCKDIHPPLNLNQASIEASRCYFCYDAPCIKACPTEINIPSFIRKISTGNLKGAAIDILSENIFGGACARVCPVETLCEEGCVRNTAEDKPVAIGLLQRHATDWLFEKKIQPFERKNLKQKRIAVVGAGPAGLSCAHRLAVLGYDVIVFEAKKKLGGLNEYGLAPYKMVNDFAQKEIAFILEVGGIKVELEKEFGRDFSMAELRKEFEAVFLGVGLSGVNALKLESENMPGVLNAVDFISDLRQTKNLSAVALGKRVVVIGGGSTAIDIAVESKRLGASSVTLVYRRGFSEMKATSVEIEFAQNNGVLIETWARAKKLIGNSKGISSVEFERTQSGSSEIFTLPCDTLFKAIGQILIPEKLGDVKEFLEITNGRILVNDERRTTLKNVFAGGDCVNGGKLTVVSVQDGKVAAEAIHKELS